MFRVILAGLFFLLSFSFVFSQDVSTDTRGIDKVYIPPSAPDSTDKQLELKNLIDQLEVELSQQINPYIGLVFSRITNDGQTDFSISFNENRAFPAASVVKFHIATYYYMTVPREEWHDDPNSALYRMIVSSNNTKTGEVLLEVAKHLGADNPIIPFNDFLINTLGMENGIYSWAWPTAPTVGFFDTRFEPGDARMISDSHGKMIRIGNLSTVADNVKGATFVMEAENNPLWETSPKFRAGMNNLRRLLGIEHQTYLSLVERNTYDFSWGKDGTLAVGDLESTSDRVINDLKIFPRGNANYMIAIMSIGQDEFTLDPIVSNLISAIRDYENILYPEVVTVSNVPSAPVILDQLNYGFIRSNQVKLYFAPDVNAEQFPNFVREGRISATWYVMKGALLRVYPVNEEWGEVILDDNRDDAFDLNGQRKPIYVQLADLQIVDPEHFEPIGYVLPGSDASTPKIIIIDVPTRTVTAFEGDQLVMKSPAIFNPQIPDGTDTYGTPREHSYIGANSLSRNMPNYPGVGYAALLTGLRSDGSNIADTGYYIHASPWQPWENLTYSETLRRRSSGCINMPSWSIQITPELSMRPDEFLFRWTGGNPNWAHTKLYHIPGVNVTRVYVIDELTQFVQGPIAKSIRAQGVNPYTLYENWANAEIQAPSYFFAKPASS